MYLVSRGAGPIVRWIWGNGEGLVIAMKRCRISLLRFRWKTSRRLKLNCGIGCGSSPCLQFVLFAWRKPLIAVFAGLMARKFFTRTVSIRDVCERILGSSGALGFARSKGTHCGRPSVGNLAVHHRYVIPLGLNLTHCSAKNVNWAGIT